MRFILILVLLLSSISQAQAYFRCNTLKCKEMRIQDKQERLMANLAKTDSQSKREELEEEIAEVKLDAERAAEKRTSTAYTK